MSDKAHPASKTVAESYRELQRKRWEKAEAAYERWIGVEHHYKRNWVSAYASALADQESSAPETSVIQKPDFEQWSIDYLDGTMERKNGGDYYLAKDVDAWVAQALESQGKTCGKSFGDEWDWHKYRCTEPEGHSGPCKQSPEKAPEVLYVEEIHLHEHSPDCRGAGCVAIVRGDKASAPLTCKCGRNLVSYAGCPACDVPAENGLGEQQK